MAFRRREIDAALQAELVVVAGELRERLFGEGGCPEWGTRFREIEARGMDVGVELARLVIEQSVAEQSRRMPDSALQSEGDEVRPAGRERVEVDTEAGPVAWDQPKAALQKGRKALFPPTAGAGAEGG